MAIIVDKPIPPEENERFNQVDQYARKCCGWFTQILVWISLTLFIVELSLKGDNIEPGFYIQFIVVYFFYFMYCFFTHTFAYLRQFQKGSDIYTIMDKLIYTPVNVQFTIECYHMVTRIRRNYGRNTIEREKRVSFKLTEIFKYKTWRDVSGPFELNTSAFSKNPHKRLVKLRLNLNMEFPDDGTSFDFQCQRQHFIDTYKNKDVYYQFSQQIIMNDFKEYNMITIDGEKHLSISPELYVLFSILMLVEFYKIYVDSYCVYQTFVIRKLVSTRNDLNNPENFKPYLKRLPSILITELFSFNDSERFGKVNNVPDLPVFDEATHSELMKKASVELGPGPDITPNPYYYPPEDARDEIIHEESTYSEKNPQAMRYSSTKAQLSDNLIISKINDNRTEVMNQNDDNPRIYQGPNPVSAKNGTLKLSSNGITGSEDKIETTENKESEKRTVLTKTKDKETELTSQKKSEEEKVNEN